MSETRKRGNAKPGGSLVSVTIFGQSYSLRADEAGSYVEELAKYVDTQMRNLSESAATADSARVAVLAAVNIADELFKLREKLRSEEELIGTTARDLTMALDESLREPTQTSPALS
jgi:cell division protein ZapA